MKLLTMQFSPASCSFIPIWSKYSPEHFVLSFRIARFFMNCFSYSYIFILVIWQQQICLHLIVSTFFYMIYIFPPNKLIISADQKLMCPIQFQCLLIFLDLPNGTFWGPSLKAIAIRNLLLSDNSS
jgi:hypothetical protein